MRRKPGTTDRLAAQVARMGGVALSSDDLDDDDLDDDQPAIHTDGKLNMEKILADLLAMLGVHIPANLDPAEFKRVLAQECIEKVKELTTGKNGSGANNNQVPKKQTNPLIPEGSGGDIAPVYMSLALENLRLQNESLKMQKHESDIMLAMGPPPTISATRIEEIALEMSRRMGAVVEGDDAALSMEDRAVHGFVELIAKHGQ